MNNNRVVYNMVNVLNKLDIIEAIDANTFWKLLVDEIVSNMEYKIDRRTVSFKQLTYKDTTV